jgi:hypothetical protein
MSSRVRKRATFSPPLGTWIAAARLKVAYQCGMHVQRGR